MGNPVLPIIIITAPSGAGKTSITRYLLQKYPFLCFSVSAATRSPRGNEKEGVDYYFISEASFKEKIANHEFIEWEMVYEGKYYGTLHAEMSRIWQQNKVPVLDIVNRDLTDACAEAEKYILQFLHSVHYTF
jgi:guanylate kinase